jgi:hypothetical protein
MAPEFDGIVMSHEFTHALEDQYWSLDVPQAPAFQAVLWAGLVVGAILLWCFGRGFCAIALVLVACSFRVPRSGHPCVIDGDNHRWHADRAAGGSNGVVLQSESAG